MTGEKRRTPYFSRRRIFWLCGVKEEVQQVELTSAERYFSECMISPLKQSCPLKRGRLAHVLVPVQMHTPSNPPSSHMGSCTRHRGTPQKRGGNYMRAVSRRDEKTAAISHHVRENDLNLRIPFTPPNDAARKKKCSKGPNATAASTRTEFTNKHLSTMLFLIRKTRLGFGGGGYRPTSGSSGGTSG